MFSLLLLSITVATAPAAEQTELLKTFRNEFVSITPGKGKFPKTFLRVARDSQDRRDNEVGIKLDFSISKYEVTQDIWQSVMGSNPSFWKGPTRKRNSVEMITFGEAVEFCKKTTKLLRAAKLIESTEEIRLPTEAEWEYTARAGTKTRYSFGDDVSLLDEYAWSTQNAAGNDPIVGAKKPNPWGLYDVHGYLSEWCLRDDGAEKTDDSKRVIRGGSWKDPAEKLTSSSRVLVAKGLRDDAVGLRCVLAKVKKTQTSKK